MKKLFPIILSILVIFSMTTSALADSKDASFDEGIDSILSYVLEKNNSASLQDLLDSSFSSAPDQGEQWTVISLLQLYGNKETAGENTLNFTTYRGALEKKVESEPARSASTRLLSALTLKLLGSESDYISSTVDEATGGLGIMSYVFGLHTINAGATSKTFTAEGLIDILIDMQLSDGGFALTGENADCDVTSMTLQALAPYYGNNEKASKTIDDGLACLSKLQKDDGSFSSMGMGGPESPAQIIILLCELGIDANTDERFIKKGNTLFDVIEQYKTSDGGYTHELGDETNATATRQALNAFTAYKIMNSGGNLYTFDSTKLLVKSEGVSQKTASEVTNTDSENGESAPAISTKTIFYIVIAGVALILCLIMFLLKKRSPKTYIFIIILAGLACLAVTFLKFSSKDEYYGKTEAVTGKSINTTISITCENIAGKGEPVPDDGIILAETTIELAEGASAYDQIVAAAKANTIQLESEGTSASGYVAGIAYIYEFDFGSLSGWMYKVNGKFADVGCSEYALKDGDKVEWVYTTDLGKDVGDNSMGAK